MADSYTLSIEHKALTRAFCAGLFAAFAAMLLLTAAWKYSQQARHLVWKSESNYISNQGRLDALLHARPKKLLFLGSSRTGRIPGAESAPDLPWDCLGLDASNAAEGVRLILNGSLPAPTDAAVEMESFFEERTTAFPHGAAATAAYAAAQLHTTLPDLNEQLRSPRPLHFTDHTHPAPADAYGMAAAVYSYIFPAN